MREEFWKGSTWYGHKRVRIICDKCETVIGDEPEGRNEELSEKYEGMNTGTHECTRCRTGRERAYDVWVTTYHGGER